MRGTAARILANAATGRNRLAGRLTSCLPMPVGPSGMQLLAAAIVLQHPPERL